MTSINPQSQFTAKCLATDLDGTLIPLPDHPDNPRALEVFSQVHERACFELIYATGRHVESVETAIEQYRLPRPEWIVCDVGSSVYRIEQAGYRLHAPYADLLDKRVAGKPRTAVEEALKEIDGLVLQEPEKQTAFKISYYTPLEKQPEIHRSVCDVLDRTQLPYTCIASIDPFEHVGLIDLLPRDVSKAHALQWLNRKLGHEVDECAYAGDSDNDYAALTCGFLAIVVANAGENLAGRVAEALEEKGFGNRFFKASAPATSGVLEGCRHFGLL